VPLIVAIKRVQVRRMYRERMQAKRERRHPNLNKCWTSGKIGDVSAAQLLYTLIDL
jgi:hypothetical protein